MGVLEKELKPYAGSIIATTKELKEVFVQVRQACLEEIPADCSTNDLIVLATNQRLVIQTKKGEFFIRSHNRQLTLFVHLNQRAKRDIALGIVIQKACEVGLRVCQVITANDELERVVRASLKEFEFSTEDVASFLEWLKQNQGQNAPQKLLSRSLQRKRADLLIVWHDQEELVSPDSKTLASFDVPGWTSEELAGIIFQELY